MQSQLDELRQELESARKQLDFSDFKSEKSKELRQELESARKQLTTLDAERKNLQEREEDLIAIKKALSAQSEDLRRTERSFEGAALQNQTRLRDAQLDLEEANGKLLRANDRVRELERELTQLRANLAQQDARFDLPEAAGLLNQLKGRRKRSKADLADVEVLLDLFCDGCDR
jgi:chromosome segregation ATPase